MLASVTFDAGVVTVIGTSGDDLIQLVGSADFQTFTVDVNGDESVFSTFNRSDVSSVSVFAGNGDDTVINTLLNDTMISGQGGNDNLQGGFLQDSLFGGAGNDTLTGRHGDDFLSGQGGDDILRGTNGLDTLRGGLGEDTISGGGGNDILFGDAGSDTIIGGDGDDEVLGGAGDDSIFGNLGDDTLNGGVGNDTLAGGEGNDFAVAGEGNDRVFGNEGNDILAGDEGNDLVAGNDGNDRVLGGEGDDRLLGGDGDDSVAGFSGNDRILGGEGNDSLGGSSGDDIIDGGGGDDDISGGAGDDRIDGGSGIDEIRLFGSQFTNDFTQFGNLTQVNDFRLPGSTIDAFLNGTDLVSTVENASFWTGGDKPPVASIDSLAAVADQRLVIQPIIVANSDGSNRAAAFGIPEQRDEIISRIDQIFGQAGVDVRFLTGVQFNDTFSNGNLGEDRTESDLDQILSRAQAAGVTSSNPNVINLLFVQSAPGTQPSVLSPTVAAVLDGNGIVLETHSRLDFSSVRERIAAATAQGIARNIGLVPTTDGDNLLNPDILGLSATLEDEPFLTAGQIAQIVDSEFTRPI